MPGPDARHAARGGMAARARVERLLAPNLWVVHSECGGHRRYIVEFHVSVPLVPKSNSSFFIRVPHVVPDSFLARFERSVRVNPALANSDSYFALSARPEMLRFQRLAGNPGIVNIDSFLTVPMVEMRDTTQPTKGTVPRLKPGTYTYFAPIHSIWIKWVLVKVLTSGGKTFGDSVSVP